MAVSRTCLLGAVAALVACGPVDPDALGGGADTWARDWQSHPAVAVLHDAPDLYAMSDVHGDYERLRALLEAGGLVSDDSDAPEWTGGTATLVITGDHIDKGPQSIEVLDYWMRLIDLAEEAGGHVLPLLGNHEAEFLADPKDDKAEALIDQLKQRGMKARTFASSADPHGRFLRERPVAAWVDGWFFSHGGNSEGHTVEEIATRFRAAVDGDRWSDKSIVGDKSLLEDRVWWKLDGEPDSELIDAYLDTLGAQHFVFGHDPNAFQDKPDGDIHGKKSGRLFLIDVGMSRGAGDYSKGRLLHVAQPGTFGERITQITYKQKIKPVDF